ncbi:Nucleic acid-binding, OB-fold-like protein, partial [Thalictrum thalictroides]
MQQKISGESIEANDVKGLVSTILKASGEETALESNEVLNWVAFADSFPLNSDGCNEFLTRLNEDLTLKSVLLGDGFKPSVADIVVFSSLHSSVSGLSATDKKKYPNVLRWMDYIQ